jgi:membrane protein YqaA with SNARE-associated domain
MTVLPTTISRAPSQERRWTVGRILALVLALAITAGIFLGWNKFEQLGVYGYPAVFLVSLLGSATLVLPAPSFAFVFAAGAVFDPLAVAIIAGLGAALGEMTGYLAGYSGQGILEDRPLYRRIERWMHKAGARVIFLLAAIPNPAFDAGGIFAGILRLPVWQFILAAWVGKSLRFWVVAYAGLLTL